jgi:hypothetical protein
MTKTRIYLITLAAAALAFTAACKSTPAPAPQAAAPAPAKTPPEAAKTPPVDYGALGRLIEDASEKRVEIAQNQLESLNEAALFQADDALARAKTAYERGETAVTPSEKEEAYKNAQFALENYTALLDKHWFELAEGARKKSLAAQQEALNLKANVAVRADYEASAGVHNQGESAYRAKDYRRAARYYLESAELYEVVSGIAEEKRRIATMALQSAETKIAESEQYAANVESEFGGEL